MVLVFLLSRLVLSVLWYLWVLLWIWLSRILSALLRLLLAVLRLWGLWIPLLRIEWIWPLSLLRICWPDSPACPPRTYRRRIALGWICRHGIGAAFFDRTALLCPRFFGCRADRWCSTIDCKYWQHQPD